MEEIFHRSNFNFTAIERCVGLPHYAICLRSITKQLLDQFNNDETFRSMYLIISLPIGKVVYPIFPDQLKAIKEIIYL